MLFQVSNVEMFSQALEGVVEVALIRGQSGGRVRCEGISWKAKFFQSGCLVTALPGDSVSVVGRQGITLLVSSKVEQSY